MPSDSIRAAIDIRTRYMRRVRENRSSGDRLADFAKLQQASFRVLRASPRGYRHFLEQQRGQSNKGVKANLVALQFEIARRETDVSP